VEGENFYCEKGEGGKWVGIRSALKKGTLNLLKSLNRSKKNSFSNKTIANMSGPSEERNYGKQRSEAGNRGWGGTLFGETGRIEEVLNLKKVKWGKKSERALKQTCPLDAKTSRAVGTRNGDSLRNLYIRQKKEGQNREQPDSIRNRNQKVGDNSQ